jgi:hypothetical protein
MRSPACVVSFRGDDDPLRTTPLFHDMNPDAQSSVPPTATRERAFSPAAQVAVWIGGGGDALAALLQGPYARELETSWGWSIVALGADRRTAAAGALASQWAARTGIEDVGSLRELARSPASILLVLGRECPVDADLDALVAEDRLVLVTAPAPGDLSEAVRIGDRAARLRTVPLVRWSKAWRTAEPLVEEVASLEGGGLRSVGVRLRGPTLDGGLRTIDAMLVDAFDVVLDICGPIEGIVAMRRPPGAPGEGDALAAVCRSASGAVVSIDVAEAAGWSREVEVVAQRARLRIDDESITRWNEDGSIAERHVSSIDPQPTPLGATPLGPTSSACLEALRTLARSRGDREDPSRIVARLACAEAARLSARTGNIESPARLVELSARP